MKDSYLFLGTFKNDYFVMNSINVRLDRKDKFLWSEHLLPIWMVKYKVLILLFELAYPLIYITYCVFKCVISLFKNVLYNRVILPIGSYYSVPCTITPAINKRINKYCGNAILIINDGVNSGYCDVNKLEHYSIFQLLTSGEIIGSLFDSLFVLYLVYKKCGRKYILFALKSFSWLLYYKALCHIPCKSTIYFHDHKDRWAFCVDNICVDNKVLIQHGSEISNSPIGCCVNLGNGKFCQEMPYKLRTVSEVYAFTNDEYLAITRSIINGTPRKHIMGYDFKVNAISHLKHSILIVGCNRLYGSIEEQLIHGLQAMDVTIYVKRHPTTNNSFYEDLLKSYSFILVDDDFFPDVDVIVSYSSTLAFEYESIGKTVIYHTDKNISMIIAEILGCLRNHN